jgi:deazaflavin-dependent oxidoreductase (nitroreductase family)
VNRLQKTVIAAHKAIYRVSRGRLLGRFGEAPMLLLTTVGRRSGQERTHPLLYVEDGDALVVVASAGGQAAHPAWYLNLVANPAVSVQIGGPRTSRRARTATGEERERLWARVTAVYRTYDEYQARTAREIPIVVLDRA